MRCGLLASATILLLWAGAIPARLDASSVDVALAGYSLLLLAWMALLSGRAWRDCVSPVRPWSGRLIAVGAGAGLISFVASGAGYTVSQRLLSFQPPEGVGLLDGTTLRLGLLACSAVASAVLEEWIFRGVLLRSLDTSPTWIAVGVSSAAFALYHVSWFQLLPTFLLGVVLAATVRRTGSVTPAVVAHVIFNLLGLALLMAVTRAAAAATGGAIQ